MKDWLSQVQMERNKEVERGWDEAALSSCMSRGVSPLVHEPVMDSIQGWW